jgi:chromosome segregation ATPase
MSNESGQPEDSDSEMTDTLPALSADGTPLERLAPVAAKPALVRGAAFDLPRLDETVRSVEERIARQDAELAMLARRLERAQENEAAAAMRAEALASEFGELRAALETERERSREIERALFEKSASVELGRARIEDAARESLRLNEEARTLRDALAIRDATIVQVVNSLAERDAQLSALQREHARLVPELVARSTVNEQAEADLQAARAKISELEAQSEHQLRNVGALTNQVRRGEASWAVAQRDLTAARAQTAVAREQLASREWRRGYRHSQWQDRDATGSLALQSAVQALEAQRDELKRKVVELSEAQVAALAAAERAAQREAASDAYRALAGDEAHAAAQRGANSGAPTPASGAAADAADEAAQTADDLLTLSAALAAEQARVSEQAAQISELQAAAETTQEEMTVLLAHLQAARKLTPEVEVDAKRKAEQKRYSEELASRDLRVTELEDENRELKATIERTRGALDEREFLIRRLERSESNNATVLGRLQNTIERLGVSPEGAPANLAASPPEPAPLQDLTVLAEVPSLADSMSLADALSLTESPPFEEPASAPGAAPEALQEAVEPAGESPEFAAPPAAAPAKSNISLLPSAGAAAKLIRVDGGTEVVHVLHRRTLIGRLPNVELHIDSSSVSRRHAVILTAPGGAIVEDCMSTNGTFVNGVKVSRQLLRDGDLLTVGEARFRFVAERPPARRE